APGHARLHHPPGVALGAVPRLRHRAVDSLAVGERAPGGNGLALSGAATSTAPEGDRARVGRLRHESARTDVSADDEGPRPVGGRTLAVEATVAGHRRAHGSADRGGAMSLFDVLPWSRERAARVRQRWSRAGGVAR